MASYVSGNTTGEYPIYLNRPWMNHSKNTLSAWTITVTAERGAILIAVLALLVRVAGESLWTIIACALHQYRARSGPETAVFRQLQVILRNAGSSVASVLEIVNTGWASRKNSPQAFSKAVVLALFPLSVVLSFTAAGILVAKVAVPAYQSNQVLLKPTACGLTAYTAPGTFFRHQSKPSDDIRQSRAYVDRCFGRPNGTSGCSQLPIQQLPYEADTSASCPFAGLCTLGDNGAMRMDTGLLDSHVHLGVNAKEEDRVGFQIVSTCSVLADFDFQELVRNPYDELPAIQAVIRANLGSVGSQNFTWEYNIVQATQSIAYTIHPFWHNAGSKITWQPIDELKFDDADTTVAFLAANKVLYTEPVFDPMFSANGTYPIKGTLDNQTYLEPDHYFTTVACTDQLRLCNSATGKCSPLDGMTTIRFDPLELNDKQIATVERIIYARWASHIYTVIYPQGPSAVSAYDQIYERYSGPLPDNQWQKEVEGWYQTALANLQFRIAEMPNHKWGEMDKDSPFYTPVGSLNYTGAQAMKDLCHQQLMRSTAQYQSFSMAGLLIVIIVSCIIILTSWVIDTCVGIQKNRRPGGDKRHKRLAWIADGKLQLLRMALHNGGHAEWSNEDKVTPIGSPADQKNIAPVVERVDASGETRIHYDADTYGHGAVRYTAYSPPKVEQDEAAYRRGQAGMEETARLETMHDTQYYRNQSATGGHEGLVESAAPLLPPRKPVPRM
ncbi:hypothetical protein CB0940_06977 [Cercospora beticola]|uniref:Uncharacterized protein n=1 Tax=Cercospora beticola TaxID=122368 RepID=A0A2G5H8P9_CERBT|nr:hypothetical protein CB0940_06977 [Cercospora beticola]PIA88683.1 hypothetical protein CB0940_06977 [Cercospora beticola]WPB02898.1 hypothetical protein RHO25_007534 [Cercospora beticola]CAK1358405.1 unnamed protein product [Cercospora beticola]